MKSYYEHAGITIYHGDCREVLPSLGSIDLVLTDPPYPDCLVEEYGYYEGILDSLEPLTCRQFIFWSAKAHFPLNYSAIHIWDKRIGCASQYERVFERNGGKEYKVFRRYPMHSLLTAQVGRDVYTGHPSQKPIGLIRDIMLIPDWNVVIDPFAGSGTTLRVAKDLGRLAIGIEIEERFCEIAAKRLSQEVLEFKL